MNRINKQFDAKNKNNLSIYFTAGHPGLNDTVSIIKALEKAGADMIEIGMPFSDPVADGPVIQKCNQVALNNGMSLKVLFEQLKHIRKDVSIPLLLMGSFNPVFKFGVENFCKQCSQVGIDGVIIPDLPADEYEENYKQFFEKYNVHNIFLITPQTSEERIKHLDSLSNGFIYIVSSYATTGKDIKTDNANSYFQKISGMKLKNPKMIGFGIKDKASFNNACAFANGAIIGTAFVKALDEEGSIEEKVMKFVKKILN
jgi:tryptophan synthase alpha chain